MKQLLLTAFLSWLIPLVISFLIFPFHESNRPLFESLMAIILACTTVGLGTWLKARTDFSIVKGLLIGVSWMALNLGLDYFLFIRGPLQMEAMTYAYDIGIVYFMFPLVLGLIGGLAKHTPIVADSVGDEEMMSDSELES